MTEKKQLQLAVMLARANPCVDAEFRVSYERDPADIAADALDLCRIAGEIRNNFGQAFSTRSLEWQSRANAVVEPYPTIGAHVAAVVVTSGVIVSVNGQHLEV